MILAVTVENDFHALTIGSILARRSRREYHILECDRIWDRYTMKWVNDGVATISRRSDGFTLDLSDVTAIWWRRVRADQKIEPGCFLQEEANLISNDCRGALAGMLATSTTANWISSPSATDRAGDKIFQLKVARTCGFRTPKTCLAQSKADVLEFMANVRAKVIVKPVVGSGGTLLFTQFVDDPHLLPESSYAACPAIYQEYIPGTRHVRLNCFGDSSFAAVIETSDLDWRPNLNVPISAWTVPSEVHNQVRRVLDFLGLRMGIVDLKETPEGELVWLEVNPQGQFLFLDGLAGMNLGEQFASFLLSEAERP